MWEYRRLIIKKYLKVLALAAAVFVSLVWSTKVIAANIEREGGEEYRKAVATSLNTCYNDSSFKGRDSSSPLTITGYGNFTGVYAFMEGSLQVPVPNSYFDKDKIKCTELVSLILNNKGITIPGRDNSATEKGTFLENMGYERVQTTNTTGECVAFEYHYEVMSGYNWVDGYTAYTQKVCASEINDDGTIGDLEIKSGDYSAVKFSFPWTRIFCAGLKLKYQGSGKGSGCQEFTKNVTKWEDFKRGLESALLSNNVSGTVGSTYRYNIPDVNNFMITESYGDAEASYVVADDAARKGIIYMLGMSYAALPPAYTEEEQFVLYQNYLKDYYGADIVCDPTENELSVLTGQGYGAVRIYEDGDFKNCYARATKNPNKKVNWINDEHHFVGANSTKCDFECLTDWLSASTITDLRGGEQYLGDVDSHGYGESGNGNNPGGSGSGSGGRGDSSSCTSSGGALSLGWILCPVLEQLSRTATSLYESAVKPQLEVEPTLFTGGDDATRSAWRTFQGMANGVFIILLLVVIFSQLTGVGIDNYGIKRILPKLIVAAILVNLSYIICELLVDLSNILGNGLQALFDGLGTSSVTVDRQSVIGRDGGAGDGVTGTIASVGVLAILGAGAFSLFANPAMLLSLLVGAIGVVVSIFFLFILLAVRKAAIVVLVVISPLAFVCYTLPNTKRLFDQWVKMMKGLLLVYPIAGLLVGGGNFVSKLLLATGLGEGEGGFWGALAAMIIGIVPIFFIPTVLKQSFSAMGNIGAKISGIGDRMGRGLTGAARNSEWNQNLQKRGKERQNLVRAGIKIDKDGNVTNRRGAFSAARRGLAKTGVGKALGYDAVMGRRAEQATKNWNEQRDAAMNLDNDVLAVQVAKGQNARTERQAEATEGVAVVTQQFANQEAANRRIEQQARIDAGAPVMNATTVRRMANNERMMREAQQNAGVAAINQQLAQQRAQAGRDAQEFKNYQDQFAGLDRKGLEVMAGLSPSPDGNGSIDNAFGANGWLNQEGGTQRMNALIGAMMNNGMENEVFSMLQQDTGGEIGRNAGVMQMLANSNNKVLKAYGKKGEGQTYADFMNGTDPNKASMRKYVEEKGAGFIDNLDDKALAQIAQYSQGGHNIMSTDLLTQAATQLKSQDAVNQVDNMLEQRNDIKLSGAQLANLKASTAKKLAGSSNANARMALVNASEDLRTRDPKRISGMDVEVRRHVDTVRQANGLGNL